MPSRGGDIPIVGIFENGESKTNSIVNGRTVYPIEELAELNPNDVVIIASSADVTDLYETFNRIQSLCPSKVLPMKSLMGLLFVAGRAEGAVGVRL